MMTELDREIWTTEFRHEVDVYARCAGIAVNDGRYRDAADHYEAAAGACRKLARIGAEAEGGVR